MDTKINPIQLDRKVEDLNAFKSRFMVNEVIDVYEELLEEIFLIRNPRFKFAPDHTEEFRQYKEEYLAGRSMEEDGEWFYFPFTKNVIHYLPDAMHQELRTARNRNIITKEEQEKFYNCKVAIAGLSVGSHPALTIAMMGGARTLKIADFDEISVSNMNRLRYDCSALGKKKAHLVASHILQLNPYADVHVYSEGITQENLDEFLDGVDVLIEEVDQLEMKIRLRVEAKKRKLPVLMATDNGDNIIMDVERYDLHPDLMIFNGVAGDLTIEEFQHLTPKDMPKLSTKIAGSDLVVPRMADSLLEVGRTLYSWPQLGDAATLCGVSLAYLVRRLANGQKITEGKMELNIEAVFDPEYMTDEAVKERKSRRDAFLKTIGLIAE